MELWRVIYLPKMCGWNFIFSTLNINLLLCRNTDNKTKQEELRLKRISLLKEMGEKYFKTESDKCLALANQVNGVAMVWMVDVGYILILGVLSQIFCQMGGKCLFFPL